MSSTRSRSQRRSVPPHMRESGFVIFGSPQVPSVYSLGVALAQLRSTSLVRLGASYLPFSTGPLWPVDDAAQGLSRTAWTYPPGFNGKLSRLFTRTIRDRFERAVRGHQERDGIAPYVITPHPRFARYTSGVDEDRLVYLNYDDYATYTKAGARIENPLEPLLVARAGTVLCSSRYQRDRFAQRFPEKADAFWHLPHGVDEAALNPAPGESPVKDTVCVVGALTARYDWALIEQVVDRLPAVEFSFCGEIGLGHIAMEREGWQAHMRTVLEHPNVNHIRSFEPGVTSNIFWNSAVNWIPYDPDLPFVKACCPVKLGNGIASGRPVISADVPECRLYPDWVGIHTSADEAAARISDALATAGSPTARDRSHEQVEFARENTWTARARQLVEILERQGGAGETRAGQAPT